MTSKKVRVGDIVEVEWIDIETIGGHGVTIDAVINEKPMMCRSWGEYSGESDDYFIIAQNKFNDLKGSPDYIRIVPGSIRRVEILKEAMMGEKKMPCKKKKGKKGGR